MSVGTFRALRESGQKSGQQKESASRDILCLTCGDLSLPFGQPAQAVTDFLNPLGYGSANVLEEDRRNTRIKDPGTEKLTVLKTT